MVLVVGQIGGTFVFGALTAPFGWITPSPRDIVLLMLFGVLAMLALACVNRSLKFAPASVVAPYQYTLIVWAIVLGYLVFGDVPDLATLAGAAIIIAAGCSSSGASSAWTPRCRGCRATVTPARAHASRDPFPVAPALERGPEAPVEAEAVDRGRRMKRAMR